MTARTTNGAASGTAEMSTNKNMVRTLDFDTTTQEFAQFEIAMPKSWNNGTVTFQPVWSHASTTTNFGVVWALQAVATSDDDALDVAFGTEQTSTDTGGTTNDRYIGPLLRSRCWYACDRRCCSVSGEARSVRWLRHDGD